MSDKIKTYTNGEVSILWNAELCFHSKNCVNNLPQVFDAESKPWINAQGASTEEIIETIKKCPSGALTYRMNTENQETQENTEISTQIKVLANGPLIVEGKFEVLDTAGNPYERKIKVSLCRCGASEKKPFCDGTHKKIDFQAS
ncbi:MAG: (4Fe-4S)-binding protein [Microscillaceae bacterium]|nr:(4Fe-4S)-binding protein [Microscillaceae bacterium]